MFKFLFKASLYSGLALCLIVAGLYVFLVSDGQKKNTTDFGAGFQISLNSEFTPENLQATVAPVALIPSSGEGVNPKSMISATSLMCDTCTVQQNLVVTGSANLGSVNATSLNVTNAISVASLTPIAVGSVTAGVTTSVLNTVSNDPWVGSISQALTSTGLPRVAYYDETGDKMHYYECANISCTSGTNFVIFDPATGKAGKHLNLVLDSNNNPHIVFHRGTAGGDGGNLMLARYVGTGGTGCDGLSAAAGTWACNVIVNAGSQSSVVMGPDGYLRIAFLSGAYPNFFLKYIKCASADCTTNTISANIDSAKWNYYSKPSLKLGSDGNPRIAYWTAETNLLKYALCATDTCSSVSTSSVPSTAVDVPDWGVATAQGYGNPMVLDASNNAYISFYGRDFTDFNTTPPDLSRVDAQVNFDVGAGAIDSSIGTDYFVARWTKNETFEADTYRFKVRADDGVRLYVDDVIRIDQWKTQVPTIYSVDIALTAGVHSVRLEYYEKTGGATAQFYIHKASQAEAFAVNFLGEYWNLNKSLLKLARCNNASCSNATILNLDTSSADVGADSAMVMGSDGFPKIAYTDYDNDDLKYIACLNASCSSKTTSNIVSAGLTGYYSSLQIDSSGLPGVAYFNYTSLRYEYVKFNTTDGMNGYNGAAAGSSGSVYANIYTQKMYAREIEGDGGSPVDKIVFNPQAQGNVGIGLTNPSQQLSISRNFSFSGISNSGKTAGYIFQGGTELLHTYTCFATVSGTYAGVGAGNPGSCGAFDDVMTGVGVNALGSLPGWNVFHSTAIGYNAYLGAGGGCQNAAIGVEAYKNGVSCSSAAIGYRAMGVAATSGNANMAIGAYAMQNLTSGAGNVYVGGNDDLNSNTTTGSYNTYLGFRAGYTAVSGNKNDTGSNNTYLGALAGPASSTQYSKAVAIGYGALVGASNAFILGGTGADAVNVGINTSLPDTDTRLHVVGDQRVDGGLCIRNATACPAYSAGRLYVDTAGTSADDAGDAFDIAEVYAAENISPGELVVPAGKVVESETEFGKIKLPKVSKTSKSYQQDLVGVVSTRPAIGISGHFVVTGPERQKENSDTAYVALAGRVPVKVTTENGVIKAGDFLTSSKLFPGYAMKATRSGQVIGQALENLANSEQRIAGSEVNGGSILVFIKPGYQVINNSFVVDESSGWLVNGPDSLNLFALSSVSNPRLTINKDGALKALASVFDLSPVFSIRNNSSESLVVSGDRVSVKTTSIKVSPNTSGSAVVKKGDNRVSVNFTSAFVSVPKIIATPQSDVGLFSIVEKNNQGFTIEIVEPASADAVFDWLVLEVYN